MKPKREIIKLSRVDKKFFKALNDQQIACRHAMIILSRQDKYAGEEFWKAAKETFPEIKTGNWIYESEKGQFERSK